MTLGVQGFLIRPTKTVVKKVKFPLTQPWQNVYVDNVVWFRTRGKERK